MFMLNLDSFDVIPVFEAKLGYKQLFDCSHLILSLHLCYWRNSLEKTNNRIKHLKRQLDESEEECSREKAAKRKVQRELEDLHENCENLQREVTNLKNKMRTDFRRSSETFC
ncbi:hypothetical protein TNCT_672141 [Trichonephila clavata]|uniref:Myosin tail domain-containing protein n=1 Tax=Trichonephila clavata TaxID=2740835 RepID=A0A8X6KW33_TRICU|nr:hypothetical protein TNCT_672141 [Trichonephila clavata]